MNKKIKTMMSLIATGLLLLGNVTQAVYAEDIVINTSSNEMIVGVHDYQTNTDSIEFLQNVNTINYSSSYTPSFSNPSEQTQQPYSILPGGSLKKAPDATSAPYSKVIMSRNGFDTTGNGVIDTWTIGSGAMVKSGVLLTAGHTIWHTTKKIWAKEYRVYVNQHGSSYGSTYFLPSEWTYSIDFINNNNSDKDWCVVKMQSDTIGTTYTGWFGYSTATNSQLLNKSITVSGYPDDNLHHYYQYYDNGTITSVSTNRFEYTASTLGGQSGGPVFDSNYIIWGIHTAGGSTTNSGVRISSTIASAISNYA